MKKLEDKTNLTRLDYFIYYRQLKEESEYTDRLLDENKLYLKKLETVIQEKTYEIKQLTSDYDEVSKILIMKTKDVERLSKQITKLTNKLEKVETTAEKQKNLIEKLKLELVKKEEELEVTNNRLEYCRSHRRSPDIEEIKAYTLDRREVEKRIRRSPNVSK